MATGLNMFSVVEELSSPAFRKIAALVSPKRGYPELPDLSDNPHPSYISMFLCAEKLCLNYFHGLGNTLLGQRRELRHEPVLQNRQLCFLSTISLALSFVLYRYNVPFLCIMCRMLWCNVSKTAPILTHNCW